MIVVDDHLALLAHAEAVPAAKIGEDLATTSLWYLRLVAAATASPTETRGPGRLGRVLGALPDPDGALERILHPARELVTVLHPMEFAVETASMQREHRLNLLARHAADAERRRRAGRGADLRFGAVAGRDGTVRTATASAV